MGTEPLPSTAEASTDQLAHLLRQLRSTAGSPSFSEITRRVEQLRADRGVHARDRAPGRMTVYDCFRAGRRRVDAALVLDIVRSLGIRGRELEVWRTRLASAPQREWATLPGVVVGLPALPKPHIGRHALVRTIVSVDGPVAITGAPGVGKSYLARRAAAEIVRAAHIDDFVVIDTSSVAPGRVRAQELAAAIMSATGAPNVGEEASLMSLVDLLRARRLALLFDDVTDLGDIAPFLSLGVRVIAVTRTAADESSEVTFVHVPPWSPEETIDHLRAKLGAEWSDADPDAARAIAVSTGGLPLAADLVAARIAERPAWSASDHLESLREAPADIMVGGSIHWSYSALSDTARRALRLLAAVPAAGFDTQAVAALLQASDDETVILLDELRRAHFIDGGARVSMHSVVRSFAAAQSSVEDSPGERRRAVDAIVDHMLGRGWSAMAKSSPGAFGYARDPGRAVTRIDAETATRFWRDELGILIDLSGAVADRRPHVAVDVSEIVRHHLDVDGRHQLSEQVHRLGLLAAERAGDGEAVAMCVLNMAQSMVRLARPGARIDLERAHGLAEQVGSDVLVLRASNALAILAAHGGDATEATRRFTEALEAAERGGFDDMLAPLNDNIGIMLARAGDIDGATGRHLRAAAIARDRGDAATVATSLINLGHVQIADSRFDEALVTANEAIALTADSVGMQHAYALTNRGLAHRALGRATDACNDHQAALALAEEIGEAALHACVLNNLGEAEFDAGQFDDSHRSFEHAHELAAAAGIKGELARALVGIAEHDMRTDDRRAARERLLLALDGFVDPQSSGAKRARQLLESLRGAA